MKAKKQQAWYGDVPNRRCTDCGELVDWDERLRCGYVAVGGPTVGTSNTPAYDPAGRYGSTPAGLVEQQKLEAHNRRYHTGGLQHTEQRGIWTLEVHRYDAGVAVGRYYLTHKRPLYGILSTLSPAGTVMSYTTEGGRTIQEIVSMVFPEEEASKWAQEGSSKKEFPEETHASTPAENRTELERYKTLKWRRIILST